MPVPDGVKDSLTEQHSWNCDSRFNSVNLNEVSAALGSTQWRAVMSSSR